MAPTSLNRCHREALFWMLVTYSRCHQTLRQDAPVSMQKIYEPGYRELLSEFGISSFSDLERRKEQVIALLPRVRQVAEEIMASNPEIED
jgi:hypothetical protein